MLHRLICNFRLTVLRILGVRLGKKIKIYGPLYIKYPRRCKIGNNVTINDLVLLNAKGGIEIGNNVTISAGCHIHSTGLSTDGGSKRHVLGKVQIEDNVWLGADVCILKNVKISQNIVVGAKSLVTKDLMVPGIYYGIPARLIKSN